MLCVVKVWERDRLLYVIECMIIYLENYSDKLLFDICEF